MSYILALLRSAPTFRDYLMTATTTIQQQRPMLGFSMAQPLSLSKKFSSET